MCKLQPHAVQIQKTAKSSRHSSTNNIWIAESLSEAWRAKGRQPFPMREIVLPCLLACTHARTHAHSWTHGLRISNNSPVCLSVCLSVPRQRFSCVFTVILRFRCYLLRNVSRILQFCEFGQHGVAVCTCFLEQFGFGGEYLTSFWGGFMTNCVLHVFSRVFSMLVIWILVRSHFARVFSRKSASESLE